MVIHKGFSCQKLSFRMQWKTFYHLKEEVSNSTESVNIVFLLILFIMCMKFSKVFIRLKKSSTLIASNLQHTLHEAGRLLYIMLQERCNV